MTASGHIASFPKSARIQASSDFRNHKEKGERLAKGCLLANWQLLPSDSFSRLGVVTSRHLGKAVIRNRARRLMRECFRLHKKEFLSEVDLILVARKLQCELGCSGDGGCTTTLIMLFLLSWVK